MRYKVFHYLWKMHDITGLLIINWRITDWIWQNSIGWTGEIGNAW